MKYGRMIIPKHFSKYSHIYLSISWYTFFVKCAVEIQTWEITLNVWINYQCCVVWRPSLILFMSLIPFLNKLQIILPLYFNSHHVCETYKGTPFETINNSLTLSSINRKKSPSTHTYVSYRNAKKQLVYYIHLCSWRHVLFKYNTIVVNSYC